MSQSAGTLPKSADSSVSHRMTVADATQISRFRELAADALSVDYPLEYLSRGSVLVFVDSRDEICGGATLTLDPPFRSLQSLPRGVRERLPPVLAADALAEVNGVWLARECRGGWLSLLFWRCLLRHILSSGRRQFVFTYPLKRQDLPATYWMARPQVLYSGPTELLPGMRRRGDETIAMVQSASLGEVLATLDGWFGGGE